MRTKTITISISKKTQKKLDKLKEKECFTNLKECQIIRKLIERAK